MGSIEMPIKLHNFPNRVSQQHERVKRLLFSEDGKMELGLIECYYILCTSWVKITANYDGIMH